MAALVIFGVVTTGLVGTPSVASADAQTPTIIDVPSGDRTNPRAVEVYGDTDYGVLLSKELDPADYTNSDRELVLLAPDGSQSVIPGPDGGEPDVTVFGDRVVAATRAQFGLSEVSSMVLPNGAWTTTTVPTSGAAYLGISATGILLKVGVGIDIEPWGTSDLVPVTGIPDGQIVNRVLAADNYGVVLYAQSYGSAPITSGALYLDTDADQVWPIAGADSLSVALSATRILWLSDTRTLSFAARPTDGNGPGSPSSVTFTDAGWTPAVFNAPLIAAGNSMILSQGTQPNADALAVSTDGTTTDLGTINGNAVADGNDILAVRAPDAEHEVLQRVSPTDGTSSTILSLAPVPAATYGLAIDGDTLETSGNNGLNERQLDFDSVSSGAPSAIDGSLQSKLFVQGDDVYSTDSLGYRQVTTPSGTGRDGAGNFGTYPLNAVGANWELANGSELVDTATGATQTAGFQTAMVDDVQYLPAADVTGLLENGVVARDLDTGQRDYISVAGCDRAAGVQAAASWLLVECQNGDWVVDQSGTTAEHELTDIPGSLLLGNGFVVGVTQAGTIEETALDDTNWQIIGTTFGLPTFPNANTIVAVSNGQIPTMAWVDTSFVAHAVLLPGVPTTGLPAHPTGHTTSVPASPGLTSTSADRSLTLHWPAASASDEVVDYVLTGVGYQAITLPASDTSYTVTGLMDGYEQPYTLTAQNAVGQSSPAKITAAAWSPNPGAPSAVTAVFDPPTSTLHVTWAWSGDIGTSELTGFQLGVPGRPTTPISAGARSVTVNAKNIAAGTTITLTAISASGSASATALSTFTPGDDLGVPKGELTGLAPVTLGNTVTFTASATNLGITGTVYIRYRDAKAAQPLGAWTYPGEWQGLANAQTLSLPDLTRGATYCFELRAIEPSGVASDWGNPTCTVIAADDRSLAINGAWHRAVAKTDLLGTATVSSSTAGYLSTTVRASKLWIVAQTCRTCGEVGVKVNGKVAWLSLESLATKGQVVISVPLTGVFSGKVELVQKTAGRPVAIDGFAALDY